MQAYIDPSRETDQHALPDIEVFELTAHEVAEMDEDMIYEYMSRHELRLASMSSKVRDAMFDTMLEEQGITGGWFYHHRFPGCLPDSDPFGPFETRDEALANAQEQIA